MNIQAINNDYCNCSINFGKRIRTHRLRKSTRLQTPLIPKSNKQKPKHDAQQVVMIGSATAGIAQAIGGIIPACINPDSLALTKLLGVLIFSGLFTAVIGMTESDTIANFLKKKGILE